MGDAGEQGARDGCAGGGIGGVRVRECKFSSAESPSNSLLQRSFSTAKQVRWLKPTKNSKTNVNSSKKRKLVRSEISKIWSASCSSDSSVFSKSKVFLRLSRSATFLTSCDSFLCPRKSHFWKIYTNFCMKLASMVWKIIVDKNVQTWVRRTLAHRKKNLRRLFLDFPTRNTENTEGYHIIKCGCEDHFLW